MIKHYSNNFPIEITSQGVKLFVRLAPKAKREQISAIEKSVNDRLVLKVSVTAVPEKGKANAALLKLLSKKLKISKSSFEVISGETDKNKTILISASDTDEVFNKLRDLFISLGLV
ncbi:MAG: DUF167 domain-containing protein [Alphaproteobacteria bacterium]|nr:DUF167 domain-containing protein [Alphaproteobacteria bacterium]